MVRIEVLDQDEGHAAVGWQRGEKFPACIKAAGRSADADDREIRFPRRRSVREQRPIRGGRLGPVR
jgi:hypothetical protein